MALGRRPLEVALLRRQGKVKLLLCRDIDVHYDDVQVLFGVNLEVDEGEIVALLGTNGAGKSTLLKAISGLVQASGAVVFDGRDMTHTPPDEVAAGRGRGAGARGVHPDQRRRQPAWPRIRRKDGAKVTADTEHVLDMFPVLRERLHEVAGNLSGGQQQMLTLGMAFISKPRLLMIDELLGLAPAVVTQLLEMVRSLRDEGTTVILVEQSVNVALTVANRAYHGEGRGALRGPGHRAVEPARPAAVGVPAGGRSEAGRGASGCGTGPRPRGPRGHPQVRGVRALDGVSFDAPGRDPGLHRPQRRRQDHAVRRHLRLHGRLRDDPLLVDGALVDLHDVPTPSALAGPGPFVPGRPAVPGLTVHEAIAVALEQHVADLDRATLHLPSVGDSEEKVHARVDELIGLLALGATSRQVRARAVDWHAAGRRPRGAGAGPDRAAGWTSCPAASPSGRRWRPCSAGP